MIKFLPSYVGSKSFWIDELSCFKGRDFVEVFAGSASLSASLANKAILNDIDPYVYKILSRYDELFVPEHFSYSDYMEVRCRDDWWKWAYCLQKMSFSGVFRYSKNGYNVPIKSKYKTESISINDDFQQSLDRWKNLSPRVFNLPYQSLSRYVDYNNVLVIDPPYEKGQASYNNKFDYHYYWEWVRINENICKDIVLFDYDENIPFTNYKTRKSRVNGSKRGSKEAMFIFDNSLREGQKGEELFHKAFPDRLEKLDGFKNDFILDGKYFIELKSDYYDINRTPNFFMERWGDKEKKSPGGPWQALLNGNHYYIYFFPKNGIYYSFTTKELVDRLEKIIYDLPLIDIPNKTWITQGYKINRELLRDIFKVKDMIWI